MAWSIADFGLRIADCMACGLACGEGKEPRPETSPGCKQMDTNAHEWGRDGRGMMTVIPTCFAVRDSGHVASMESLACGGAGLGDKAALLRGESFVRGGAFSCF